MSIDVLAKISSALAATEPLETFLLSFKARAGSTSEKHTDCTLPLAIKLMINGR
jgi:hypothetical protein